MPTSGAFMTFTLDIICNKQVTVTSAHHWQNTEAKGIVLVYQVTVTLLPIKSINECGGHGIHVDGGETQGGFCSGAKIISIGGTGIYESSFGGNTYAGCYVEEARGRGYLADTPDQATFVGCFSESGKLSDNTNALLGWSTKNEDGIFWLFRWLDGLKAWSTEMGNTFPSSMRVSYQTALGHARGVGLQGFPSLLLGPVEADPETGKARAVRIETTAISGPPPQVGPYQQGDLIFKAPSDYDNPDQSPQYVGWVCVNDQDPNHLVWNRFGKIEP